MTFSLIIEHFMLMTLKWVVSKIVFKDRQFSNS